jgi:hypothetical protein
MYENNDRDESDLQIVERRRLLEIVSKKGLSFLTKSELEELNGLLETKDYNNNERANRAKRKLLKKINIAIYESYR